MPCHFPLSFMLHLPGWTWQEPVGSWKNELNSFLSFWHLISYNPNWSLNLAEYLVGLGVHGWRMNELEAYLFHLCLTQRSVWLLKLVHFISCKALIEKNRGSSWGGGVISLLWQNPRQTGSLPLWLGWTFTYDWGTECPSPRVGFFFLMYCDWKRKKKGRPFEQFYKLRLWKL